MKNTQRGIVSLPVLIAMLIILIVLGVVYLALVHKPKQTQNLGVTGNNVGEMPIDTTSKIYINNVYGFKFSYPSSYTAFESLEGKWGTPTPVASGGIAGKDTSGDVYSLILSPLNYGDASDPSSITIFEENGSSIYDDHVITVKHFWSVIDKDNTINNPTAKLIGYKTVNGIDFVLFQVRNFRTIRIDPSNGHVTETVWTPRAIFVADGRFFSISAGPDTPEQVFNSIVDSFQLIPASKSLPQYIKGENVF